VKLVDRMSAFSEGGSRTRKNQYHTVLDHVKKVSQADSRTISAFMKT